MSSTLSVKDLCDRYGITEHTVLGWIRSGELRAVNVGRAPGKIKPRWRITQDALDDFERLRSNAQAVAVAPRRRKRHEPEVIEFYK
jgi:excisionase family DNA binding protein